MISRAVRSMTYRRCASRRRASALWRRIAVAYAARRAQNGRVSRDIGADAFRSPALLQRGRGRRRRRSARCAYLGFERSRADIAFSAVSDRKTRMRLFPDLTQAIDLAPERDRRSTKISRSTTTTSRRGGGSKRTYLAGVDCFLQADTARRFLAAGRPRTGGARALPLARPVFAPARPGCGAPRWRLRSAESRTRRTASVSTCSPARSSPPVRHDAAEARFAGLRYGVPRDRPHGALGDQDTIVVGRH